MKIVIKTFAKYDKGYIAKQRPIKRSIVEYYVDTLQRLFKPDLIYIVYDFNIGGFIKAEFKDYKRVKLISQNDFNNIKGAIIIDIGYFYDFKRLRKLIKNNGDLKKAIHFKINTDQDIQGMKDFIKRDYRDYFNPIAKYYLEPIGEWLARVLKDTPITPNFVTIFNILFFTFFFVIWIFNGSYFSMILLALFIQVYHMLDITDGHLARLKNMKSSYGAWVDGGGDKFTFQVIFISISLSLFVRSSNVFYLLLCIFLLAGEGLRSYLAYLTDRFYIGHITDDKLKMKVKSMPLVKIFLFFLENDILYHLISLFALLNRLDWLLIFYAIYFNLMWLGYVAYFSYRYIKTGS